MNDMVSWKDYEGMDGFGMSTQQEVADLNKALTAGQEINPPGSVTAGDGFALRVESLEKTLRVLTYRMEHIRLWKMVSKIAATNTVEEHNVLIDYGQNPDAGFIAEGDLPESDDSSYERRHTVIRFLGTTRKVTHVMSLVKPAHGNVIAQETVNGTMHLLRIVERALFYGDNSLSNLQFDGYFKLMDDGAPAANIIDLRGAPLSEDILNDAALTISDAPNYGRGTDLFANPKVLADLVKTFFPKERTMPGGIQGGMVGLDIKGFTSMSGDVKFQPDVFITDGGAPTVAVGDAAKRPGTPTISTAVTTPVNAASQFGDDDAGDYFMAIQACNRYGRSAEVDVDAGAITVAAGDDIRFGVTPGGSTTVEWYEVFRTKKGGADGTERQILRVPNTAGAGEETIIDLNAKIPGTSEAILFQGNIENMSIKQLAPMIKIPLATIDSSIRWMQLIYLAAELYSPQKNVVFKNIGRASGYVGQL